MSELLELRSGQRTWKWCGQVLNVTLLPAALVPAASRRAFLARMVSLAGRAGARLSGAMVCVGLMQHVTSFARALCSDTTAHRRRTALKAATGKPS